MAAPSLHRVFRYNLTLCTTSFFFDNRSCIFCPRFRDKTSIGGTGPHLADSPRGYLYRKRQVCILDRLSRKEDCHALLSRATASIEKRRHLMIGGLDHIFEQIVSRYKAEFIGGFLQGDFHDPRFENHTDAQSHRSDETSRGRCLHRVARIPCPSSNI